MNGLKVALNFEKIDLALRPYRFRFCLLQGITLNQATYNQQLEGIFNASAFCSFPLRVSNVEKSNERLSSGYFPGV
jgi:hypothetical protein